MLGFSGVVDVDMKLGCLQILIDELATVDLSWYSQYAQQATQRAPCSTLNSEKWAIHLISKFRILYTLLHYTIRCTFD